MPFIDSPSTNELATADGDSSGYIKVASNAAYYPGAKLWLKDNTHKKQYVVTDVQSTDAIGLREYIEWRSQTDPEYVPRPPAPSYGRSDLSEWTTANGTRVFQQKTVVRVELPNPAKVPLV